MIFPVTSSPGCRDALATNVLDNSAVISALQSRLRGYEHHVTGPDHKTLRLGTLSAILSDVTDYLNIERSRLEQELFD